MQKLLFSFTFAKKLMKAKVRFVVFESDDWGYCGEMKDKKTLDLLLPDEDKRKEQRMEFNNTLETFQDMMNLFALLERFRDSLGRPAVFTSNYVMSNPDYERIRESGFKEYFSIPLSSGFPSGWNDRGEIIMAANQGIKRNIWRPEFHGLAHFNFRAWMKALREGDKKARKYFDNYLASTSATFPALSEYAADSSIGAFESLQEQVSLVSSGCKIFKSVFGYRPVSTIPPHDIWNSDTEIAFLRCGLKYLQSERNRFKSVMFESPSRQLSPLGAMKSIILLYGPLFKILRNVRLELRDEPSEAELCTEILFREGIPAVVGTHRVNYVSSVNPSVSHSGRKKLEEYLKYLVESDNIIFLSATELSQICYEGVSRIRFGENVLVRNYRDEEIKISCHGGKECSARNLTLDKEADFVPSGNESLYLNVPARSTVLVEKR